MHEPFGSDQQRSSLADGALPTGRELGRRALLSKQTLEEKLATIADGDPLALFPLGARRTRARHLYLDPDRVFEESVYNVTALSIQLRAEDDFDAWLARRVDEAIDNLLRRDREALREGRLSARLVRESAEYLRGCWGLSAEAGFKAAVRFNGLTDRSRRTFFALLVEHRTVAQCLEDGLGPPHQMREHAIRAIEAILGPRPGSVPAVDLLDGGSEAIR